jgi:phospholipid-translocating ATPase
MNQYFLLIGLLQLIPSATPVDPITTLGPLLFIFTVSALKEAVDDLGRWKADKLSNERLVTVLRAGGKPVQVQSQHVLVGDLLFLEDGQQMPCDVVLLWSSDAEGGAFCMTANLDGETDLKGRSAAPDTQALGAHAAACFAGEIECASPNPHVYRFDSRIRLTRGSGEWRPLGLHNTLWQSTQLRNTASAIAVAVYCGSDTKLGQNKAKPPTKWTKLDRFINRLTTLIFAVQFLSVLIFAAVGIAWAFEHNVEASYLMELPDPEWWTWLLIPVRFLLLNSLMIPISLKVTLDVVKFMYAKFVDWDLDLYYEPADLQAKAVSTSIGEDLGQIEHVFTDKTGTLTENVMRFHKCSIGAQLYPTAGLPRDATAVSDDTLRDRVQKTDSVEFEFFRALALCQTAVPRDEHAAAQTAGGGDGAAAAPGSDAEFVASLSSASLPRVRDKPAKRGPLPEYESSSPDELALLLAASELGVVFTHRDRTLVRLRVHERRTEEYDWLAELAFSSDRKRMSAIVRAKSTGQIWLFCKGADTVMLPLLAERQMLAARATTVAHCDVFANGGLRTLLVARRRLGDDEFAQWKTRYDAAAAAMQNRDDALAAAAAELEQQLELLGATAIEDKLQDGVPETIQLMRDAGIGVWMLTGDKFSTAVQIALSCNLIKRGGGPAGSGTASPVTSRATLPTAALSNALRGDDDTDADNGGGGGGGGAGDGGGNPDDPALLLARYALVTIEGEDRDTAVASLRERYRAWKQRQLPRYFSVIVRGSTLAHLLDEPELSGALAQFCLSAVTVICCRVTPKQKARIVALAKERNMLTLAIGDGGNDVGMIQEAHVGVGISGREGLQAARAADYAVGRFKHLGKLLLVHGRYAYKRTSWIAQYAFYKSMIICMLQISFGFVSAFSGSSLFDSSSLTLYNVAFTNFYTMAAALDRDVSASTSMAVPALYGETQASKACNKKTFGLWVARAIYQGLLVFFVMVLSSDQWLLDGRPIDHELAAVASYICLLTLQAMTIIIESHTLTAINWLIIVLSYVAYWVFLLLLSAFGAGSWSSVLLVSSMPTFWLANLLTVTAALLPVVGLRTLKRLTNPSLCARVQLIEHLPSAVARHLLAGINDSSLDVAMSESSPLIGNDMQDDS